MLGWLIAIGILQLIVLIYIAYRLERLPDAMTLARMLDVINQKLPLP